MTEPCCPDQERDPHEWGECMLWATGQPGRDRRRYLREHPEVAAAPDPPE